MSCFCAQLAMGYHRCLPGETLWVVIVVKKGVAAQSCRNGPTPYIGPSRECFKVRLYPEAPMRSRLRLLIVGLVLANFVVALQFLPRTARAESGFDHTCTYSQGCHGGTGCFLCLLGSPQNCHYDGNCAQ